MDIHKPKPWHGWRELLKEVGTIVIGILIALGLEQVVETIHERKIADEARMAVKAEVRENLWWIERREKYAGCMDQKIAQIRDLLDRARHGRPFPTVLAVGGDVHAKLTSLRWEANAQGGRASLFTSEEQRQLGNIYYTTEQLRRTQDAGEEIWSKLAAIEGLDHLTPREIDDFGMLLSQARYEGSSAALNIRRAHQWASLMHLTADNPNQFEVAANRLGVTSCRSITAQP